MVDSDVVHVRLDDEEWMSKHLGGLAREVECPRPEHIVPDREVEASNEHEGIHRSSMFDCRVPAIETSREEGELAGVGGRRSGHNRLALDLDFFWIPAPATDPGREHVDRCLEQFLGNRSLDSEGLTQSHRRNQCRDEECVAKGLWRGVLLWQAKPEAVLRGIDTFDLDRCSELYAAVIPLDLEAVGSHREILTSVRVDFRGLREPSL